MNCAAIVLATYNRPTHLREWLAAVGRLEGGPYRVVVVDDGSPQDLASICADAPLDVTYVRQENAGPAAARNRGVREAEECDLILFTDDDCRPERDWARKLIAAHNGDGSRLVGGRVVNALPRNPFSEASQSILTYSYGHFGDFSDPLSFFTTNNLCVARDRFDALGGFDESYGFASEDRDFSFRWKQAGGHLHYAPEASVHHLHTLEPKSFVRQHFSYGRGARRFHSRAESIEEGAIELGSVAFYAGLLLHPLKRPSPRALAVSGLIGIAHLALATGYVWEMARGKRARGNT